MSGTKKATVARGENASVYVTKYALTEGVRLCKVKDFSGDYVYVEWPGTSSCGIGVQVARGDWHETAEAAQARASEMAKARLESLDRQRLKLEEIARGSVRFIEDSK